MLDANGKEIEYGDCVEFLGSQFAIIGESNIAGDDVVFLGELVGGEPAKPWCEMADRVRKVA